MIRELLHNTPFLIGTAVTVIGIGFGKIWVIVCGIIIMVLALVV